MSEAFILIVQLATTLGARAIAELDGCWEHVVDDNWHIAINGHREPAKCSTGEDVPPFACYVQWNGWPAGLITPAGGTIAAGEAANEDTLIDALKAAIAKAEAA